MNWLEPSPEELKEEFRAMGPEHLVTNLSGWVYDPHWTYRKADLVQFLREELERRGIDTSVAFVGDEFRIDRRYALDPSGSRLTVLPEDAEELEARYGPDWDSEFAGAEVTRRECTGAFVGWREWRLVRHAETGDLALGSLWTPRFWESPVIRAHLPSPDPEWKLASPGLYSWRPEFARKSPSLASVAGHVLHYGRVMVHERGFRSQYARIRDLTLRFSSETERQGALFHGYMRVLDDNNPNLRDLIYSSYEDEPLYPMPRSEAEAYAEWLAGKYQCPVELEEVTIKELEELWMSDA